MIITGTLQQLATTQPTHEPKMKQERSLARLGTRVRDNSTISLEFATQWDSGRKCYRSHVGWEVLKDGGTARSYSWIFPAAVAFTRTEQSGRYSRKTLAAAHQQAQEMLTELAQGSPEAFEDLFDLEYSALEKQELYA
jgi:hypothetical protein